MDTEKGMYWLVAVVAIVAVVGMLFLFVTAPKGGTEDVSGSANRFASSTPTVVYCNYTGGITPFNQGLLDYVVRSDYSNPDSPNKLSIHHRMSIVNRGLASQYLVLNSIGKNNLTDVVFSMLEHYECVIPDWLYAKLEGVYLAKYMDQNTARATIIVFEDRATAEYVAQILMALSTDELQNKTVNGNFVYYTAQKAYWWSHNNMLIRVAAHTTPIKYDKYGNVVQGSVTDLMPCEPLDVLGAMRDQCIYNMFWKEVSSDILYAYLAKLPSDAEQIPWPVPGQFANLSTGMSWPSDDEWTNVQMGCDNAAIEAWEKVGDPWSGTSRVLERPDDKVKITDASTAKRWYYLGDRVTLLASAVAIDGNFGNVLADVKNDIYPHPEQTTVVMQKTQCANRVPYTQR